MNAEDQRRLHNIATIGTVTKLDPDNALMRLAVGELETDWLNIPAVAAGQVRVWRCPSIGEQFLLVSPSGDLANAIPVMSIYSDANPAPSTDPNEIRIRYNDTDFCSINTRDSNVTLHLSQMTAEAKSNITFDTPSAQFTGDVSIGGNVQINGDTHCDQTIRAAVEVTAKSINLTTHTHSGVSSGPSNTRGPQ